MSKNFDRIKAEIVAVIWIGLSVLLFLSLWSYYPLDPSFNTFSWGRSIQNWCGIVGSFSADLFYRSIGVMSWLVALLAMSKGIKTAINQKFEFTKSNFLWGLSLVLLSSVLIYAHFDFWFIFGTELPASGVIGHIIFKTFSMGLNVVGTKVLLWVAWLSSFIMFFDQSIVGIFNKAIEGLNLVTHYFLTKIKNININMTAPNFKFNLIPLKKAGQVTQTSFNFIDDKDEEEQSKKIKAKSIKVVDDIDLDEEISDTTVESLKKEPKRKVQIKFKHIQKVENWLLPKLSLIEDPPATRVKTDQNEIKERAKILKDKLSLFGVTGEVVAAKSGPAVTLYEFRPDSSVKISKITELADDLAMALSSESLRIIAPIPGRDVVGIETANRIRETVYHKDMLAEEKFWSEELKLPMGLGRKVDGSPEIVDLRKMPHLLIAGTTGSGKSVFTVSTIIGLIYRHSPKTLKLILIDPKQVDLAAFERIPHLAMPLVTDSKQAVLSLKWAVNEMEKRYRSMSQFGARGIESFNETVAELSVEQKQEHEQINFEMENTPGKRGNMYYFDPQPYLVIVVEEFADLMSVDKGNVEHSVIRLAQKARACGIHLILCLQSPRKEFVTGAIKSNIPGRIAFKAASSMESRIILDEGGAERLLASGDMLYRGPGSAHVIRHHGPFLKDKDIQAVTEAWADQAEPVFDPNILNLLNGSESSETTGSMELDEEGQDDKYTEIMDWLQTQKEVSASLIQRRFALGYPRAARLVESFERHGVVGPANGSKPRQVLINNLKQLSLT